MSSSSVNVEEARCKANIAYPNVALLTRHLLALASGTGLGLLLDTIPTDDPMLGVGSMTIGNDEFLLTTSEEKTRGEHRWCPLRAFLTLV